MAIVRKNIYENEKLTDKQIKMLNDLENRPVICDEDCPELSDEQLSKMMTIAEKQRAERRRQLISVRVSPETLRTAKSLGKGYTGIMGRLLDLAMKDPDMIRKCL